MDKETNQESPSLPSNNNSIKEETSRKQLSATGSGGFAAAAAAGGDRLKRDEWSEGAVSSLLEAYESKWILRNRAKLKGHDWEDVARFVSSRANYTKSPKTQTQCKNKIESMKKRYRSESATADASSWPLYPRLDLLLRGSAAATAAVAPQPPPPPQSQQQQPPPPTLQASNHSPPLMLLETSHVLPQPPPQPLAPPPPPPPPAIGTAQNSHGSNGVERGAKEDGVGTKLSDHVSDKNAMETDSSTPALYSEKEKLRSKKLKMKMDRKKKRRREEWEIADSIRWLAEVVVRSEQARMDTMRELEKMRIEAEAKRGEMDLKRTEIIANTQLEIAKLFAGVGKGVDSSLRIGRS
ncbi:hypothetical protein P3X46_011324 [Hevea brasiliensis]|uniref:Myb/SANT-like DNA-binding domain-containing protein n=1 Tax=Hevea brasiliensis TaxID=3981 RepID=A0ABQ9MJH6_HEVBR|nr:trihelix transcription factor ASIL1 [Hevea brasiliensis]KAJ9179548.1 hypothetical protein P3X46_011324 [Hevea brasiliensis]